MPSNIQTEIALDDFLSGAINRHRLNEIMNMNGVNETDLALEEHHTAIHVVRQYNIMKQVQNVHTDFFKKTVQPEKAPAKVISMPPRVFVMRIAAGLIIILAGFTMVQYFGSTGTGFYKSLHNSYSVTENRSGTENKSELVEAFKKGDHTTVISLYNQISNPGNRELFFAGNAYLETGSTSKAIELMQQILAHNKTSGELLYQDEAEYYLAMGYLKNNETDKALPILTGIANEPAHTYHNKVSRITLLKMKWLGHK